MKKFGLVASVLLVAAMTFWVMGCSSDQSTPTSTSAVVPNPPGGGGGGNAGGQSGTTLLDQYVTIQCFNYFDWSFEKSVGSPAQAVCLGECVTLTANVTATKGTHHQGFSGVVYEKNGGAVATTDLKIRVVLLENCGGGGGFDSVAGADVDLSSNPILDPEESGTYSYTINYAFNESCHYKVSAEITITNHSGHLGQPFGPSPDSPSIDGCAPSNNCVTVTDVAGNFKDALNAISTAWSAGAATPSSLEFCASGTGQFTFEVCNTSASSGETFKGENNLVVDGDVVATASYDLTTVGCSDGGGCGRTIGYYKTHAVAELYGHNPDVVSAYLPISLGSLNVTVNTQVVSIMQRVGPGGASNGILKLYAQMLAAKLNIAGAGNSTGTPTDASCIATALADANAFLQTHTADSWTSLTQAERQMVNGWMSTFDQYNNGLLCAPHCE